MMNVQNTVPENNYSKFPHNSGAYQRDKGTNENNYQWPKLEQFDQKNQEVLDYKPEFKINIQKFILA
jgi:hypothetical protein